MLVRCGGQIRTAAMGGVTGIDLGVAMRLGDALGYDAAALAFLLPMAEAGTVAALRTPGEGAE